MITTDYLFDKKIIWLGNDLICHDNFPYFKKQLITVLGALMLNRDSKNKIEDSFDAIKHELDYTLLSMEGELTREDHCLWYIRLFKKGSSYKMSFYSGEEFDLEDAMSAYREWTDGGFTSLKWSDIVGDTDIDSYDVFDKLNESFDKTLINPNLSISLIEVDQHKF